MTRADEERAIRAACSAAGLVALGHVCVSGGVDLGTTRRLVTLFLALLDSQVHKAAQLAAALVAAQRQADTNNDDDHGNVRGH